MSDKNVMEVWLCPNCGIKITCYPSKSMGPWACLQCGTNMVEEPGPVELPPKSELSKRVEDVLAFMGDKNGKVPAIPHDLFCHGWDTGFRRGWDARNALPPKSEPITASEVTYCETCRHTACELILEEQANDVKRKEAYDSFINRVSCRPPRSGIVEVCFNEGWDARDKEITELKAMIPSVETGSCSNIAFDATARLKEKNNEIAALKSSLERVTSQRDMYFDSIQGFGKEIAELKQIIEYMKDDILDRGKRLREQVTEIAELKAKLNKTYKIFPG